MKTKVKNTFLLSAFLNAIGTTSILYGASFEIIEAVVKVRSTLCGFDNPSFQGSGFLFEHKETSYVLTSEHAVIHSNNGYCHDVLIPKHGRVKAFLKLAEFGNGLALLKLDKPISESMSLDDIQPSTLKDGLKINVTGFPYDEFENPKINNEGEILTKNLTRKLFPLTSQLIETKNAFGVFGMSGGPVFNSEKQFVGILSHQFFKHAPGRKAQLQEFSSQSALETHLLIIPGSLALFWVRQVLNANPAVSYFLRDPDDQARGKTTIISGGLRFSGTHTISDHPIGGADGAGAQVIEKDEAIGGGEESSSDTLPSSPLQNRINVLITRDVNHHDAVWYLPTLEAWKQKVRNHLVLPTDEIRVLAFLNTSTDDVDVKDVTSISDFFQKLSDPNLEPVAIMKSRSSFGRDHPLEKLLTLKTSIQSSIDELKKIKNITPQSTSLLRQVETLTSLMTEDKWFYIRTQSLTKLSDTTKLEGAWRPLFNSEAFNATTDLLSDLVRLKELLNHLKV